jgi:hypothetical protein
MQQYSSGIENILSQQPEIKVYYSSIAGDTISTSIELFKEETREAKNLKTTAQFETQLDNIFSYLSSQ